MVRTPASTTPSSRPPPSKSPDPRYGSSAGGGASTAPPTRPGDRADQEHDEHRPGPSPRGRRRSTPSSWPGARRRERRPRVRPDPGPARSPAGRVGASSVGGSTFAAVLAAVTVPAMPGQPGAKSARAARGGAGEGVDSRAQRRGVVAEDPVHAVGEQGVHHRRVVDGPRLHLGGPGVGLRDEPGVACRYSAAGASASTDGRDRAGGELGRRRDEEPHRRERRRELLHRLEARELEALDDHGRGGRGRRGPSGIRSSRVSSLTSAGSMRPPYSAGALVSASNCRPGSIVE